MAPNMTKCIRVTCTTQQDCVVLGCGETAFCSNGQCMVSGDDWNPPQPCQQQINLSPYAEWRASPMGLAGRDPIFFAQLQTETNLSPSLKDCIETFCLNCHGVMGRRQIGIDNPAGTPQCANILDPEFGPESFPQLFTRDQLNAWPGKDPGDLKTLEAAKYGALGRDGVSCTACHHMSGDGLSSPVSKERFTGNFEVGPPDEIYGPFDGVVETPMRNSLGVTPSGAPQILQSGLCGTCHVIRVPVLDDLVDGNIPLACLDTTQLGNPTVGSGTEFLEVCAHLKEGDPCSVGPEAGTCKLYFRFEQTTYFEWLNSQFHETNNQPDTFESCQDCHMPRKFDGEALAFKIANVQDLDLPAAHNSVPISLETREPFGRHLLYGLNVFINEMFQQFPLILGRRQIDYLNSNAKPALLAAREAVLKQAAETTATIQVGQLTLEDNVLRADVTVTNLAGHHLPSGVGFRRLFIEFLVCDTASGDDCSCDSGASWRSGCTDSLGVIINGKNGLALASEFSCPDDAGVPSPNPVCPAPPIDRIQGCPDRQGPDNQCYQRHFEFIEHQYQVQIYTERVAACDGTFTSSVTHLCEEVKDNRLLPTGWRSDGLYAAVTGPGPLAKHDPDYPTDGTPAGGSDTVRYEILLTEEQARLVKSVRATLYFQAIPPGFLNERFHDAFLGAAEKTDIERLYYITSRLNVDSRSDDGEAFIKDWKLELGHHAPAVITGACCDVSVGTCQSAVTEPQCQCPECEWTVDATCDVVDCGGMPPDCIFGQLGLIAIPMMLVAMCWMRLNRYRRVTRRSSNQERSA